MKYAILSTDNNPEYYSLVPLAAYSWKKIGYEPVLLAVNLPADIFSLMQRYCTTFHIEPHPGVKDSTIAQLWRLFWREEGEVITADSDMVIAKDIFSHNYHPDKINSYGFDLTGRSQLPICYVQASGAKWNELIGFEVQIPAKSYSPHWEEYWSVDQELLTDKAKAYGLHNIQFFDRGNNNKHGLPTGRWDRHDWSHVPPEIIDVHMKRGDHNAQLQVFHTLWPGDDPAWLVDFLKQLK